MHIAEVRVWDGLEKQARRRVLVISRNHRDNWIKYGLSNLDITSTPIERFAYMQAWRYQVERSFQNAESESGMSDCQVRKYNGWYHHMALVILAPAFIVKERIENNTDLPLLSSRDVRILIIALFTGDIAQIEKRKLQMRIRHRQRYKDIMRYYKS